MITALYREFAGLCNASLVSYAGFLPLSLENRARLGNWNKPSAPDGSGMKFAHNRESGGGMIQEKQDLWRPYLNALEDWLYILWQADPYTLEFSYVSLAVTKILGYSPEECLEPDFLDRIIDSEDRDKVKNSWRTAVDEGIETSIDFRAITASRKTIWLSCAVRVQEDARSQPILCGWMADITQHKKTEDDLESSLSLLRGALDSTADGILVVSTESKITTFNQRFIDMWRIPKEILNSNDDSYVLSFVMDQVKDSQTFLKKVLELYSKPAEISHDFIEFKDGRIFERFSRPQRIGSNIVGRVWSFRDITETRRNEAIQSALYRIAEITSAAEDLNEFYKSLHKIIGELMYARNFYIAFYDEEKQLLSFPYSVDEADAVRAPRGLKRGLTEYVLRTQEPLLATPEKFEELVRQGEAEDVGTPSVDWLGVPLMTGGKSYGVLVVQSYHTNVRFGEQEKEVLTFVSQHISVALERKRSEEQLLKAHHELEERVRERTVDLSRAIEALKQSEERYRSLFENVPVGVYRSHPDGRMVNANPAFLKILGYESLEQLLTRNTQVEEYGPEYSKSEFRDRLERDGEVQGLESVLRKLDNTVIHVREHARLIRDADGNSIYHEGTVEDITERKKIEQKKDELIAIVGHELRAPLTSIRGSLGYISNNMSDQLTPRLKKLIELASRGSERLVRLINDMLDIDKIESGKMEFHLKPLELAPVVEYTIEANRAYGDQFQVRFQLNEVPSGVKVNADSDRLVQVLTNVLSNAAKFSPPNEVVGISVCQTENLVRVAVTDRGPGIPEYFRKNIFQKFAQATSNLAPEKRGSGLGLSISRAIMEKMGGTIHFQTELAKGTTFYLDLPVA